MENQTKQQNYLSISYLVIASLIWGSTFVAQSIGVKYLGPFTFNGTRSFLSAFFLLIGLIIYLKWTKQNIKTIITPRALLISSMMGIVFFLATSTQQMAIQHTSVGKAGFLTSLYIVFVPLLSPILRKRIPFFHFFWVIVTLCGTYILCAVDMKMDITKISKYDLLLIFSAFCFALQIVLVEKFGKVINACLLTGMQFLVAFLLSIVPILCFEQATLKTINFQNALLALMYAGLFSGCLAFTLQVVAQKRVPSAIASLIMSLEAVFALVCGVIILKQFLSIHELIGSGIVLVGVIGSLIKKKEKKELG